MTIFADQPANYKSTLAEKFAAYRAEHGIKQRTQPAPSPKLPPYRYTRFLEYADLGAMMKVAKFLIGAALRAGKIPAGPKEPPPRTLIIIIDGVRYILRVAAYAPAVIPRPVTQPVDRRALVRIGKVDETRGPPRQPKVGERP